MDKSAGLNNFRDEVREGFYVSSQMKHLWAAQLEVLKEIDRVCIKHGIRWFADCGTLLGAVRHGGYIPWDDDLDICMLRDDYRRFHQYALNDLPKEYEVRTYENEKNWHYNTHIVNRRTIALAGEELEKYHGCPYIVGVDIFVWDYVAQDPEEEEMRRMLYGMVSAVGSDEGMDGDTLTEEAEHYLTIAEQYCNVKLDRGSHLRRQIYALADRLSSLYPSSGASEVVLMPFWSRDHNHKFPLKYLLEIVKLPFEGMMINVPAAYDAVLRIEYGDYLRIVRGGGMHDYPTFQDQEDYLAEQLGIPDLYCYHFRESDLENERDEKVTGLKQRALDYCQIASRISKMVNELKQTGRFEEVFSLLEKCQEGAISIGNAIEENVRESGELLHLLEGFCERIYQTALALESGSEEDFDAACDEMRSEIGRIRNCISETVPEKRKILFLPFGAEYWCYLAHIYKEAVKDPENEVVVMPIPVYEKDFAGRIGEMHYAPDAYPEEISLTDYRGYDIRQQHPDVIYIQNGYDRYHYSYTIPAEYYSSELKKYTEKLVYVPYFKLGALDPGDERLRQTARYFVKIPGLIHADKVLVESKQLRSLYIDELCNLCGEETRGVWDAKIDIDEAVYTEHSQWPIKEIPENWRGIIQKENGEKKKIILYQFSVSSLFQYKEDLLEKVRSVLRVFYAHRESVALIWRLQQTIACSMEQIGRDLWLEYRRIVDEYRSAGWGILDELNDAETTEALADAYYGDPDPVMQRIRNQGKPVMIQNVQIKGNR